MDLERLSPRRLAASGWVRNLVDAALVVGLLFRESGGAGPSQPLQAAPRPLSLVAVGGAVALILALADSALPVFGLGVVVASIRLAQRRIPARRLYQAVDVVSRSGVFLIAVVLGTLARVWPWPEQLMASAGEVASAGIGAVAAVLLNNFRHPHLAANGPASKWCTKPWLRTYCYEWRCPGTTLPEKPVAA